MVSAKLLTIRHHIAHRNHKKRRSNTPTCEFCQFHTYVEGLNNHGMEKHLPIVQFVSCVAALCGMAVAQPSTVAPERELAIKTFGGYPVSGNISSLWLAGSDGRPLLMVYFFGPKDWYERQIRMHPLHSIDSLPRHVRSPDSEIECQGQR